MPEEIKKEATESPEITTDKKPAEASPAVPEELTALKGKLQTIADDLGITIDELSPDKVREVIGADIEYNLQNTPEGKQALKTLYETTYKDIIKEPAPPPPGKVSSLDLDKLDVPNEIAEDPTALAKFILKKAAEQKGESLTKDEVKQIVASSVVESFKLEQTRNEITTDINNLKSQYPNIPDTVIKGLILECAETGTLPSETFGKKIKPLLKDGEDETAQIASLKGKETPAGTEKGGIAPGEKKLTPEEINAKWNALLEKAGLSIME